MDGAPTSRNTSGYNGVYKHSNGSWVAQITFKKKTYYLGSYGNIRDAVAARKKGEEMYDNFLEWYYRQFPEKQKEQNADGVSVTVLSAMLPAEKTEQG